VGSREKKRLLVRPARRSRSRSFNPHSPRELVHAPPVDREIRGINAFGHHHQLKDIKRPPSIQLQDLHQAIIILVVVSHPRERNWNEGTLHEPLFVKRSVLGSLHSRIWPREGDCVATDLTFVDYTGLNIRNPAPVFAMQWPLVRAGTSLDSHGHYRSMGIQASIGNLSATAPSTRHSADSCKSGNYIFDGPVERIGIDLK
jgi:hypothetical protein